MTYTISAFPKIWHLGDPKVADLLDGPIEVTEKIDGSQFSAGNINGELQYRTKGVTNQQVDTGMFGPIIEFFTYLFNNGSLPLNIVYHGEYLKSPKHNTLNYSRVPKNNFTLFGMRNIETEEMYDHLEMRANAALLQFDVVPLIYQGEWTQSRDKLLEFLNQESYLGGVQMEGIVVKNYTKKGEYAGRELPLIAGKYVSEAFKEKHEKNPEYMSKKDKVWEIAKQYQSEARWNKAIFALRDKGELENSPRDIGNLLKYINQDVIDEEKDNIKEELWKAFHRDIRKISTAGFAEFYKKKLVEDNNE